MTSDALTQPGSLDDDLHDRVVLLMQTGGLDQIVRGLEGIFHHADVEDAVGFAVERLVVRDRQVGVKDVSAFIYAVAKNYLKREATRPVTAAEVDGEFPSAEQDLLTQETFRVIAGIARKWPNAHVRTVTLLYLEAAANMEPLSLIDAAALTGQILGEEISIGSVGTWHARGLAKLRDAIASDDYGVLG